MTARAVSAMAGVTKSSPFSKAVFSAMRKLYPEELADKSFDNTGLLLEAPFNRNTKLRNSVLLTIDLTTAVAQEAIDKKASVVVAYHPIIFKGLKQLNLENSQQTSLLRLAAEGISVYSPHTAIDAANGGNADWMADIVTAKRLNTKAKPSSMVVSSAVEKLGSYSLFRFPSHPIPGNEIALAECKHVRKVVQPNPNYLSAGGGRIVQFDNPRPLAEIISMITTYFGNPRAFSIAKPHGRQISDISISAIGICAGSGASMLGGLAEIDLMVTGEISHHEALAAVESGKSVIAFGHSNSERGYLGAVMKDKLTEALREEWSNARAEFSLQRGQQVEASDASEVYKEADLEVEVSTEDTDPFEMLIYER